MNMKLYNEIIEDEVNHFMREHNLAFRWQSTYAFEKRKELLVHMYYVCMQKTPIEVTYEIESDYGLKKFMYDAYRKVRVHMPDIVVSIVPTAKIITISIKKLDTNKYEYISNTGESQ